MIAYLSFQRSNRIRPDSLALDTDRSALISSTIFSPSDDLELLIWALDRGYAGKVANPAAYASLRQKLDDLKRSENLTFTQTEFRDALNGLLKSFPDGHLYAAIDLFKESELYEATDGSCAYGVPRKKTRNKRPWGFDFDPLNTRTLILQIESFEMIPEEFEALTEQYSLLARSDKLIIDMRGNRGGNLNYVSRLAAFLWGQPLRGYSPIQYYPTPYKRSHQLTGSVQDVLRNNYWLLSTRQDRRVIHEFSHSPVETMTGIDTENEPHDIIIDRDASRGYQGEIALLVDENCASACERFLEALEAHPRVKTFGSKTTGAVKYGNIGILELPKSKLQISIATEFVDYKDARETEHLGYSPTFSHQTIEAVSATLRREQPRAPANSTHKSSLRK